MAGGLPPAPQPLAPLMPPNPWLANANANANNGAAPGAAAGAGGAAAPGGGGAAPAGAGAGGPINPDDLHPIDAAILNDPWNPHHFFLPPFLRRRQLGDATAVGAALALEARPARLRVLELRSCRLSGALLGHVCEGLRTGAWPVLEELRLALGDLGPGDVQVLCNEGLAKMEKAGVSLRVLELSGNEVGSGVGDVGGVGLFVGRRVSSLNPLEHESHIPMPFLTTNTTQHNSSAPAAGSDTSRTPSRRGSAPTCGSWRWRRWECGTGTC